MPLMASTTALLAVSFGVSQICPSATAVNASGSKITPETVFGKVGLLIRFKITAATAICHDMELLTYNVKDFKFIKGIKMFTPL